MKVYRSLRELPSRRPPSSVTIGNFDGVHRGHLKIIERLERHATALEAVPTVLTFSPHPQQVLHGRHPDALATLERKLELLDSAGIEQVIVMRFTKRISLIEPEDFIERILVRGLNTKAVIVGSNFRFGHFARGDSIMLKSFAKGLGFSFEAVGLMRLRGRSVSSTEIRHALAEGDIRWANLALGRPHFIPGAVIAGRGRGRPMGFPTANLRPPPNFCIPRIGIYAGYLVLGSSRLPAAISIGTNPTFGHGKLSIEAHVIDFHRDIRGRVAGIELVRYMREEKVFPSTDSLAEAIAQDVRNVRKTLPSRPGQTQGPSGFCR